jgi:basic membrane protein A
VCGKENPLRRVTRLTTAIFAGALMLTGCGGGGTETNTGSAPTGESTAATGESTATSEEAAASSDRKIGLAYDIGGRGDQSFNDSAARGLDQAVEDLGIDAANVTELEAGGEETDADKAERLRLLAADGHDPIIAVGFAYSTPLAEVAPEFPDTRFAIVDDEFATGENIANLVFAEEQGSFLVGAAAALASETGNIGFIGGVEVPLIQKFQAGYVAGAEAVNPDIEVQVTYLTQPPDFSGFNDPARGRTAAEGMFDGGADVVYHAAGGSGGGVFAAADAADAWAIGVDSDQYLTADPELQDHILTSMLKNVDVAVNEFITAVANEEFEAGVQRFDLEADGVGYSQSGGFVDPYVEQLEEFKSQIIAGEIEVPQVPGE